MKHRYFLLKPLGTEGRIYGALIKQKLKTKLMLSNTEEKRGNKSRKNCVTTVFTFSFVEMKFVKKTDPNKTVQLLNNQ
jgi:hypothetical protein